MKISKRMLIVLLGMGIFVISCTSQPFGSWWLEMRITRPGPLGGGTLKVPFEITDDGTLIPGEGAWRGFYGQPSENWLIRVDGFVTFQGEYDQGEILVTRLVVREPFSCVFVERIGQSWEEVPDTTRALDECGSATKAMLANDIAYYSRMHFSILAKDEANSDDFPASMGSIVIHKGTVPSTGTQ